jgi:ribosomal protein L37AE/L43A
MVNKFEKKFFKRFPDLTKNLSHIETYQGWDQLIWNLTEKVEREIQGWPANEKPIILQIKQKYGGLRFYISPINERIANWISETERRSFEYCEYCGKSAILRNSKYWIMTLCDSHAKKEGYKILTSKTKE